MSANTRSVALWLFICCFLIFAMVVLGGVTRLTDSGLSIVEWQPIMGAIPPLSQADWMATFEKYKQFPEYQKVNHGMSLSEFQVIFAFEYAHRLLGRLIGIVFFVPLVWFLVRKAIPKKYIKHLIMIFILGGLQGAMGWYMVMSGLVDHPDVSQYRLTAHLSLALLIYGYIFWIALSLIRQGSLSTGELSSLSKWLLGLVALTIVSGGFVAGTNAGFIYNTFPLMEGHLIPTDYTFSQLFENHATIQFNHRLLAITTFVVTLGLYFKSRRSNISMRAQQAVNILMAMAMIQVALGIATLILVVPVWLGATHQAGAVSLLTTALWAVYELLPNRALQVR